MFEGWFVGMLRIVEEVWKKNSLFMMRCDMHDAGDLVMCLCDINGHIGRHIDGFDGDHVWYGVVQRNLQGRMLLVLYGKGTMCVNYMVLEGRKEEGEIQNWRKWEKNVNVLIKKEHRLFIQNVKAIPGEFQHALVATDIDKRKIRNVVKKMHTERRNICLLKDVKISRRFEEKVIELVDVGEPILW